MKRDDRVILRAVKCFQIDGRHLNGHERCQVAQDGLAVLIGSTRADRIHRGNDCLAVIGTQRQGAHRQRLAAGAIARLDHHIGPRHRQAPAEAAVEIGVARLDGGLGRVQIRLGAGFIQRVKPMQGARP